MFLKDELRQLMGEIECGKIVNFTYEAMTNGDYYAFDVIGINYDYRIEKVPVVDDKEERE
jgi:hypothetical protein